MRLTVLVLVTLVACEAPASCPEGAIERPARADAIRARLATVLEGASLLRVHSGPICFADGPSVIDERTHAVVLDRALGEGEAAARLGHLLVHVRDGSPYREGPHCDVVVARALDAEARAHALELDLRRALSVAPDVLRYELEPAYWAAPPDERVALVRAYLEAHPDGAPGIDALASAYRQRCER
ncbi:hemophore-related protein [Sandaracinus amylolyticus]|uniref:Uncharacterized protein n=1 Tax=Sandaracinus amylolyticus TaxID=927083 RepID=A0A0F6YKI0_9BACT|nr:hemophore-related protein [Sandaracinus amylolyticus]AKF08403.1 hypothetical protein DB32_005552 [Sandaracinus amylolyticus]